MVKKKRGRRGSASSETAQTKENSPSRVQAIKGKSFAIDEKESPQKKASELERPKADAAGSSERVKIRDEFSSPIFEKPKILKGKEETSGLKETKKPLQKETSTTTQAAKDKTSEKPKPGKIIEKIIEQKPIKPMAAPEQKPASKESVTPQKKPAAANGSFEKLKKFASSPKRNGVTKSKEEEKPKTQERKVHGAEQVKKTQPAPSENIQVFKGGKSISKQPNAGTVKTSHITPPPHIDKPTAPMHAKLSGEKTAPARPEKRVAPMASSTSQPKMHDTSSNVAKNLQPSAMESVECSLDKEIEELADKIPQEDQAPPLEQEAISGRSEFTGYERKHRTAGARPQKRPISTRRIREQKELERLESKSNNKLFLVALIIIAIGFLLSTFSGDKAPETEVAISGTTTGSQVADVPEKLDMELIKGSDADSGAVAAAEADAGKQVPPPASAKASLKLESKSMAKTVSASVSSEASVSRLVRSAGIGSTRSAELAAMVVMESERNGIDPKLATSLILAESSFQATVKSSRGKIGLMQISPAMEKRMLQTLGLTKQPGQKLTNPKYNMALGITYLAHLQSQYNGEMEKALIAYNQGPENVEALMESKRKGYLPKPLYLYLNNINKYYKQFPIQKPVQVTKLVGVTPPTGQASRISYLIRAVGISRGESYILANLVISESRKVGLNPILTTAIVMAESSFQAGVKSKSGKIGLMQISPASETEMLKALKLEKQPGTDLRDPAYNLNLGLRYLKSLQDWYDGNIEYALIAYNQGSEMLDSIMAQEPNYKLPNRLANYLKNIQRYYNRWVLNEASQTPLPFKTLLKPTALAEKPRKIAVEIEKPFEVE